MRHTINYFKLIKSNKYFCTFGYIQIDRIVYIDCSKNNKSLVRNPPLPFPSQDL